MGILTLLLVVLLTSNTVSAKLLCEDGKLRKKGTLLSETEAKALKTKITNKLARVTDALEQQKKKSEGMTKQKANLEARLKIVNNCRN